MDEARLQELDALYTASISPYGQESAEKFRFRVCLEYPALAASLRAAWARVAELEATIRAVSDHCDSHADCVDSERGIAEVPNVAMRVQMIIGELGKCAACNGSGVVGSGICHCGDDMDRHDMHSGHGPVEAPYQCHICHAIESRDARMKRLGAAEWLESQAGNLDAGAKLSIGQGQLMAIAERLKAEG